MGTTTSVVWESNGGKHTVIETCVHCPNLRADRIV